MIAVFGEKCLPLLNSSALRKMFYRTFARRHGTRAIPPGGVSDLSE